jgi:hypothetical protein
MAYLDNFGDRLKISTASERPTQLPTAARERADSSVSRPA